MTSRPAPAHDTPAARAALHVDDHPGASPPTVWLHHGVGSARSWDAFLPSAAAGRRALAYDRRGFGRSPHGRRFTPALFDEDAGDLVALLEGLPGPAHLVGHSDGGTVALLVAARHPDLVRSLTVVATHVRGDARTIDTLRRLGPPSGWDPRVRRVLHRDHGDDWAAVADAWHRLWTSPDWETWSVEGELVHVRAPVLVVHDRRDDLAPPLHAETVARLVPGARVLWLDTGTHDPHLRERAAFVTALRTLWRGTEDGGTHRRAGWGRSR